MEGTTVEREYSALGNLFQQIITDMKNGTPIWEDFIAKASKLHAVLKSAITAVSAYLDAFQKIADAATNARGATKEIGTALTRMCLRHKAIETRMKAFTCAIMDCLVNPLQEKLEDWKKTLINLDKDHSREYKRARSELKKRSTDTLRLQKKARKGKGGDLQRRVETCMQDVNERRQILEDAEKKAVRAALVEERSRFCLFVALLKPVVDCEVAMLGEVGHLQEGAGQLLRQTNEPYSLPAASEQVISDLQAMSGSAHWTPPSSPPSPRPLGLGSRKSSSLCSSISSLNSSSSGSHSGSSSVHHLLGSNGAQSSNGTLQPTSTHANRSVSQPPRLGSVSSRDSGFTSQDTLHLPPLVEFRKKGSDNTSAASSCTTPVGNQDSPTLHLEGLEQSDGSDSHMKMLASDSHSISHDGSGSATWPDLKDTMQFERAASAIMSDRPHTISTAYEKGHTRPALSVHTFTAHGSSESSLSLVTHISGSASQPVSPCCPPPNALRGSSSASSQGVIYARPPLPVRCSSLERPVVPAKCGQGNHSQTTDHKIGKPSSLPPHLTKDQPQATYVNMFELATMAANRAQGLQLNNSNVDHAHTVHEKVCESSTSESSLESSSGYGSQGGCAVDEGGQFSQVPIDENATTLVDIEVNTGFQECCINSNGNDGLSISLCSLDEAVRNLDEVTTPVVFATINKNKPFVPKRRPLSMTATCPPAGLRLALAARRGSAGGNPGKPPPPVRRSSSISRPQGAPGHHEFVNNHAVSHPTSQNEGDDNLPPPPAFLLNPSDHQTDNNQQSSSRSSTPVAHGKGINVAETVKALTELKHTPASPSLIRRNAALQNQQTTHTVPNNLGSQSVLSSFQQSKSTFTALQNSNVNPIYGTTGHKMFTYIDHNNSIHGSRNSINLSYQKENMNQSLRENYEDKQNCAINSGGYSATVSYSSSTSSSIYSESTMSSFGQKTTSYPSSAVNSQNTFGKQMNMSNMGCSPSVEKKNLFSPSGNSIYAQPSQIIAGFNNLGFGGNRNNDGNMSPLAMRKMSSTPRSQSADRRGSDFGSSGGLIAAISARLAPQLSPRNSRRSISGASDNDMSSNLHHGAAFKSSQDSLASFHHSPSHKNSMQKSSPCVVSAVQPAFLDKLSATLKQRQASNSPNKAFAVRQIINTKAQPDPRVCHGSLMEQIKRGATLKRNKHCNDRSAPKIR